MYKYKLIGKHNNQQDFLKFDDITKTLSKFPTFPKFGKNRK